MSVVISGVTLPAKKKIAFALRYVRGIGLSLALKILSECQISDDIRVFELSESDANKIRDYIEKYKIPVEGQLNNLINGYIQRLKDNGSRRGDRHSKGLSVRGQRTKTNCRTRKGKKKLVSSKSTSNKK